MRANVLIRKTLKLQYLARLRHHLAYSKNLDPSYLRPRHIKTTFLNRAQDWGNYFQIARHPHHLNALQWVLNLTRTLRFRHRYCLNRYFHRPHQLTEVYKAIPTFPPQ